MNVVQLSVLFVIAVTIAAILAQFGLTSLAFGAGVIALFLLVTTIVRY